MAIEERDSRDQTAAQKRLERYFDQLIEDKVFKTHGEIAAKCGTTDAGLSQILYDPQRRLSVEQCLRLAHALGESPMDILTKAGRKDIAAILDGLWPKRRDHMAVTRREREHLEQWRHLTLKDKHLVSAFIDICVAATRVSTDGPNGRRLNGRRAGVRPTSKSLRVSRASSR